MDYKGLLQLFLKNAVFLPLIFHINDTIVRWHVALSCRSNLYALQGRHLLYDEFKCINNAIHVKFVLKDILMSQWIEIFLMYQQIMLQM